MKMPYINVQSDKLPSGGHVELQVAYCYDETKSPEIVDSHSEVVSAIYECLGQAEYELLEVVDNCEYAFADFEDFMNSDPVGKPKRNVEVQSIADVETIHPNVIAVDSHGTVFRLNDDGDVEFDFGPDL